MFNMYGKAGWCLFFIAACEFIAIGWVYGADCHWKEINRMIGPRKIQPIVTVVWKYVGPILCLVNWQIKITYYYFTIQILTTWSRRSVDYAVCCTAFDKVTVYMCRRCQYTTLLHIARYLMEAMCIRSGPKLFATWYQPALVSGFPCTCCTFS